MRISDWSSDVCSSDLRWPDRCPRRVAATAGKRLRRSCAAGWHSQGSQGCACADGSPSARPCEDLAIPWELQPRSEEHTSELQSLMRISYAVFCLIKKPLLLNAHTIWTDGRLEITLYLSEKYQR